MTSISNSFVSNDFKKFKFSELFTEFSKPKEPYNFPMMIQGKSCTLTVAKDGYFYPLPYREETVRTASKGYALPSVIGRRDRETHIETGVDSGLFYNTPCIQVRFTLTFPH